MLLAGIRRRHEFAEAAPGTAEQWREFLAGAPLPGVVGGGHYGVLCGADPTGFEYMTAVQVESFAGVPDGTGRMRVPPQRYAVFGLAPGSSVEATWRQIFVWLESPNADYRSAHLPDFECYPVGTDPCAPGAGVEFWVGVVPRTG